MPNQPNRTNIEIIDLSCSDDTLVEMSEKSSEKLCPKKSQTKKIQQTHFHQEKTKAQIGVNISNNMMMLLTATSHTVLKQILHHILS